ncbi:peptide/nickel transport system ATP-binding protein/oligopeptide transport system ATP-binding protein [Geodermatophilus pulveris]|uniref:Peptide/nickel transport system ATP-binding protein/oligopeptide transport system ATP-binding protein n=1 Tax=Geodermatophilus pulveris TaxID=1564159 RepID=A0A239I7N1_9ACTN|nr:ABC transporter ATP-binding protein [Geodermatophilus pulveris]SNS89600.1 peptide/nickel transport system ATP-binding protein/oligopeptide transport system ATP-binding protein [Geodermatophilus pulveris]
MSSPVLSIRGLTTEFVTPAGVVKAVNDVSWDLYPGETLGVVGESGSGKSVTAMSILGLVPSPPGRVVAGEILFEDRDLRTMPARELRQLRGSRIGMVFQDPMTSLNPVLSVGRQIAEALLLHDRGLGRERARARTVELLALVGVPNPEGRYDQYPHEFSGGMRQRAMIAMAIANDPTVLIADEPTTALDVTIQAQVLEVLRAARDRTNAATVLITHDLGVIAEHADRVVVMYGGKVVEVADVRTVFAAPRHPYTLGLMTSLPRLDVELERLDPIPGSPPSLIDLPTGCSFHPRCRVSRGREVCRTQVPPLYDVGGGQQSACHFAEEVPAAMAEVSRAMGADPGSAGR